MSIDKKTQARDLASGSYPYNVHSRPLKNIMCKRITTFSLLIRDFARMNVHRGVSAGTASLGKCSRIEDQDRVDDLESRYISLELSMS